MGNVIEAEDMAMHLKTKCLLNGNITMRSKSSLNGEARESLRRKLLWHSVLL